MSIIPASCLSASDLSALGHNVLAEVRRDRRHRIDLHAVNRSLASHGEAVDRLCRSSVARPRAAKAVRRLSA